MDNKPRLVDVDALREWLENLLAECRRQMKRCEGSAAINNLNDVSPPIQIHAIVFHHPYVNIPFCVFLFTRMADVPDGQVEVHGSYDFIKSLRSNFSGILSIRKWSARNPHSTSYALGKSTWEYRDAVRIALWGSFKNEYLQMNRHVLTHGPIGSPYFSRTILSDQEYYACYRGDPCELDPKDVAADFYQVQLDTPTSPDDKGRLDDRVEALGAYILPPVWVGSSPRLSTSQSLRGWLGRQAEQLAVSGKLGSTEILVSKDGFLSLTVESKDEALRLLRFLFGVAVLEDANWQTIQSLDDVQPATYLSTRKRVKLEYTSSHMLDVSPRVELAQVRFSTTDKLALKHRAEVPKRFVRRVLNTANKLYGQGGVEEIVPLLAEACTLHRAGAFAQSLLVSWIAVEYCVNSLFTEIIESEDFSSKQRKAILDDRNITAAVRLHWLKSVERLEDHLYNESDSIRKKRNDIIHPKVKKSKKARVLQEDSWRALHLARELIKDLALEQS